MRGAKPHRRVEEAFERDCCVRDGEHVLVACSGGPDSVALAALLAHVCAARRLRLTIGHVNHGARASAWQDEAVVLRAGAALGVPVKVAALPPAAGRRSESAMRTARYEALSTVALQIGAGVVATAHTAEDQTETVLLALFRGTGRDGLRGMPERRALARSVDLVRPLLRFAREPLRRYVEAAALPYALDPTNADLEIRRNAVRRLLAEMRPLFPGLDSAVSRAAKLAADDAAGVPLADLRRRVREILSRNDALRDAGFVHIEAAARALGRGRSGRFALGNGLELTIEKGQLSVHREDR